MRKNILKSLLLGALAVSAALVTGCFGSNDAPTGLNNQDATLSIALGLGDVGKKGSLGKSATISYKQLVVTMVSNAAVPDTVRDTIFPGENNFTAIATDTQVVTKSYNIKPLRSWHVTVSTLDQNDSVIHSDTGSALNVLLGQNRTVVLNLTSRFVMYAAKFTLPDSVRVVGGAFAQKLNVTRFMMVVDGDTVVDSSKTYFSHGGPGHKLQFDYIKAGEDHTLKLYVFGEVPGSTWPANKPLFGDSVVVSANPDSVYKPTLPWIGPGSKSDPDYDSTNVGGAKVGLTIHIGKVQLVDIDATISDTISFGKRRFK